MASAEPNVSMAFMDFIIVLYLLVLYIKKIF